MNSKTSNSLLSC